MRRRGRWAVCLLAGAVVLVVAVCVGSVPVPLGSMFPAAARYLFGTPLPDTVSPTMAAIFWVIRAPRVLLAFLVGAALGVSGAVMQSVLRNPLASSYTLGVSSGASLGVSLLMMAGAALPLAGQFVFPAAGALCGILTVLLAVAFASALDRNMESTTVVLVGMVLSLFLTAVVTVISALSRDLLERLLHWQMGSFYGKEWLHAGLLLPVILILGAALFAHTRELDMLTFGEEQAALAGVSVRRVKWRLLCLSAALTGAAVAFAGVIGFVDLIAPHVARRLFGSKHRAVLPVSALLGGTLLAAADLVARIVLPASELPVGAVTALLGAPFFAFLFFRRQKEARG